MFALLLGNTCVRLNAIDRGDLARLGLNIFCSFVVGPCWVTCIVLTLALCFLQLLFFQFFVSLISPISLIFLSCIVIMRQNNFLSVFSE